MSVKAAFLAIGVPHAVATTESSRAERAMLEFDIKSQTRAQHFIAQVAHESGLLRYFEEIASGAEYEGRANLGNTHRGDGVRYKGRGPIQLTGRANYRWAGKLLGLPLEANPKLASQHIIGWRIAGLYWHAHGLNALADVGNIVGITHVINGGENGLASRRAYLAKLQRVDARPTDPLAGFTAAERRWISEYDRLIGTYSVSPRRGVLQRVMRQQRKRVWRAAQPRSRGGDGHGWNHAHRRARYDALLARTS